MVADCFFSERDGKTDEFFYGSVRLSVEMRAGRPIYAVNYIIGIHVIPIIGFFHTLCSRREGEPAKGVCLSSRPTPLDRHFAAVWWLSTARAEVPCENTDGRQALRQSETHHKLCDRPRGGSM